MLRQSGSQIIRDSDVKVPGVQTLENVDVFHRCILLPRKDTGPVRGHQPTSAEARRRPTGYGGAAFAHFATRDFPGLPSRSSRSERRLVEPGGIEPPTSC